MLFMLMFWWWLSMTSYWIVWYFFINFVFHFNSNSLRKHLESDWNASKKNKQTILLVFHILPENNILQSHIVVAPLSLFERETNEKRLTSLVHHQLFVACEFVLCFVRERRWHQSHLHTTINTSQWWWWCDSNGILHLRIYFFFSRLVVYGSHCWISLDKDYVFVFPTRFSPLVSLTKCRGVKILHTYHTSH